MKYCPFCGATLLGGAASFCPECGKPIPEAVLTQPDELMDNIERIIPWTGDPAESPVPATEESMPRSNGSRSDSKKQQGSTKKKKLKPKSAPKKKKKRKPTAAERFNKSEIVDENYDGYYNDVRPVDNGHEKEKMDPELIKKIFMVAGGAALVIMLAIVMMLLL